MRTLVIAIAIAICASEFLPGARARQGSNQAGTDEARARTELTAILAQRDDAAEKHDTERFLSFYAADFGWRLAGGRTLNRQETEQVLRLIASGDNLEIKQRSTIKSIKMRGSEAVLSVVNESVVRQRLSDGSIKEDTSSGEKRETWVNTDQGWKLRFIDNAKSKEMQTTINGTKVDPAKAPGNGLTPTPNSEDQNVLQEGYALVFVYRLKDGTVVKTPVDCDDVRLAEMTGGSFIKAKLKPGKHSFHSEKGPAVEINIESGKIYFLVINLAIGFPKGRGVLEVDTSNVGPTAYKLPKLIELRPLGRDNIQDIARVIVENQ